MFQRDNETEGTLESPNKAASSPPSISLPKGGGAIRGIGEKFAANSVTGTGSLSVPIYTSPGRSGFGPQLSLSYDSGTGNGPFGAPALPGAASLRPISPHAPSMAPASCYAADRRG